MTRRNMHFYRLWHHGGITAWLQADDITAVWVTAKITGELWQ